MTMPSSTTALPPAQVLTPREERAKELKAWMARHPGLAGRSVYFNFNRARVHTRYEKLLKAQAEYLFAHANAVVRLEGNCDERGTVGYNLALGQRRAHAVAVLLEALGTNPKQIETVSYGKQRPVAMQNTPADWAMNRRVDIVYMNRPPKGCQPTLPSRDRSRSSSWKRRELRRLKARICVGAKF